MRSYHMRTPYEELPDEELPDEELPYEELPSPPYFMDRLLFMMNRYNNEANADLIWIWSFYRLTVHPRSLIFGPVLRFHLFP